MVILTKQGHVLLKSVESYSLVDIFACQDKYPRSHPSQVTIRQFPQTGWLKPS